MMYLLSLMGCWSQKTEPEQVADSAEADTATDSDTGSNTEIDTGEENRTCSYDIPSLFSSVKELGVGLGPQGELLGYWTIEFKEDGFQWNYSDVTEEGTYRCQGTEVNRIDGEESGTFDTSTDILIWENVEYVRLP